MEKILKAKKLHRSDFSPEDWQKHKAYASDFTEKAFECKETVERRDSLSLSIDEFRMSYEAANRPLIITNEIILWPAFIKWSFSYLTSKFPDSKLQCGNTDTGSNIMLKTKHFIEYLNTQIDDNPLYISDDNFDRKCPDLLSDYWVPKYFPDDLFEGIKNRPSYRWLLIGPKRSGTKINKNQLSTSAWNASIVGYKLWALFPPNISPLLIKNPRLFEGSENAESFFWFRDVLPKITVKYGITPFIFMQRPGDLVYIPSNWWYAVLNITDTLAITHSFVSSCNFDSVWRCAKRFKPKFFSRWKNKLYARNYELWKHGIKLDSIDKSSKSSGDSEEEKIEQEIQKKINRRGRSRFTSQTPEREIVNKEEQPKLNPNNSEQQKSSVNIDTIQTNKKKSRFTQLTDRSSHSLSEKSKSFTSLSPISSNCSSSQNSRSSSNSSQSQSWTSSKKYSHARKRNQSRSSENSISMNNKSKQFYRSKKSFNSEKYKKYNGKRFCDS
ncbi:hypothetical protein SteCoe_10961 [Stentor coeruleus]|uniref:JmjC domain-containing protein n=1 Tax=Stentor coeruleus TaxID=5963 RepID=A0A1R2CEB5_9CILI|nr:hypothetical protein SteCoe_10961 [Stentor coeruleus]